MTENNTQQFLSSMQQSLQSQTFVKLSLGNYRGEEEGLNNLYARKVVIKENDKLSFTYRYQTRDIVKNYSFEEAFALLAKLLEDDFKTATLFTTEFDLHLNNKTTDNSTLKKNKASHNEAPPESHDRNKKRIIKTESPYLKELGITDASGVVFKNSQDKFRQIDKYIEILSGLIDGLNKNNIRKIVDMGSGKGYLTFALYDYLTDNLKTNPQVIGVEYRSDMVELCNKIAAKSNFTNLNFVRGKIDDYDCKGANIVIALHACDTATDDAIAKAIKAKSDLIVVAPCCQKQIRRQMEKAKTENELAFLLEHGIFMERQAEMVTDGLRALIMEYFGYSTKVFEFISDSHTPKNVMIVGTRKKTSAEHKAEILAEIIKAKQFFGIHQHYLERVLGL
jgi:SAM-dependent methyltransferase